MSILLMTWCFILSIICSNVASEKSALHSLLKRSIIRQAACTDHPQCLQRTDICNSADHDLVEALCPLMCGVCHCEDDALVNCTAMMPAVCSLDEGLELCPKSCGLCGQPPKADVICADQLLDITCSDLPDPCTDPLGRIACVKFCGICKDTYTSVTTTSPVVIQPKSTTYLSLIPTVSSSTQPQPMSTSFYTLLFSSRKTIGPLSNNETSVSTPSVNKTSISTPITTSSTSLPNATLSLTTNVVRSINTTTTATFMGKAPSILAPSATPLANATSVLTTSATQLANATSITNIIKTPSIKINATSVPTTRLSITTKLAPVPMLATNATSITHSIVFTQTTQSESTTPAVFTPTTGLQSSTDSPSTTLMSTLSLRTSSTITQHSTSVLQSIPPTPTSPCVPNPCLNNGTCRVTGCSFSCACKVAQTDRLCGTRGFTSFAKGTIKDANIQRASGLAVSRLHQHVMYTHNDKGDSSRFFAVDINTGATLATFTLRGTQHYDWEDMAYGPCADDCRAGRCSPCSPPHRYCLYIGDTGDHNGDGGRNDIHMLREPRVLQDSDVDVIDTLEFTWSQQSADSLMVDPFGDIYIVSKASPGQHAKVAKLPRSFWGSWSRGALDMSLTADLMVTSLQADPRGGAISPDGKEVLFVYAQDVYYYSVPDFEYIRTVQGALPVVVSQRQLRERTEAVGWDPTERGFYTLAEGDQQTIFYHQRL